MRASIADAVEALAAPLAQGGVTRVRDHRPWPLPARRWVMAQTWTDLLFAHWDVEPEALLGLVPPQLPLDTIAGRAWITVTPFAVRGLRLRHTLPVPGVSAFPEINVRTYVTVGGQPGIYFFSLDAATRLGVAVARRAYRLPYFHARMSMRQDSGAISYDSRRTSPQAPAGARFRARYGPTGATFIAKPGTLEHWLTERYCLYTLDDDARPLRGEIHHAPWSLQPAEADIAVNTMGDEAALRLAGRPLLHFARRQDVVFWRLEAV